MSETTIVKKKVSSNRNRTAGHNYERDICNYFKSIGFTKCKTSRQASRLLDDNKIDLAYLPFNVQCKYVNSPINYTTLLKEINTSIKTNLEDRVQYPTIIFHKRKNKDSLVVMDIEEFTKLLNNYEYNKVREKLYH
jgi:hypothetical protein